MRKKSVIYSEMLLGNHSSDEEAIVMLKHFKIVADSCHELGNRFFMAFREANERYLDLINVCKARGIYRK